MTNKWFFPLSLFDSRCDCTANQKRVNKYIKFQSTNTEYSKRIDSKNRAELIAKKSFFLIDNNERLRRNVVVVFQVSVSIYESLIIK